MEKQTQTPSIHPSLRDQIKQFIKETEVLKFELLRAGYLSPKTSISLRRDSINIALMEKADAEPGVDLESIFSKLRIELIHQLRGDLKAAFDGELQTQREINQSILRILSKKTGWRTFFPFLSLSEGKLYRVVPRRSIITGNIAEFGKLREAIQSQYPHRFMTKIDDNVRYLKELIDYTEYLSIKLFELQKLIEDKVRVFCAFGGFAVGVVVLALT